MFLKKKKYLKGGVVAVTRLSYNFKLKLKKNFYFASIKNNIGLSQKSRRTIFVKGKIKKNYFYFSYTNSYQLIHTFYTILNYQLSFKDRNALVLLYSSLNI